jgi:hypothetical protein
MRSGIWLGKSPEKFLEGPAFWTIYRPSAPSEAGRRQRTANATPRPRGRTGRASGAICRRWSYGETRIRTGDTTIFRDGGRRTASQDWPASGRFLAWLPVVVSPRIRPVWWCIGTWRARRVPIAVLPARKPHAPPHRRRTGAECRLTPFARRFAERLESLFRLCRSRVRTRPRASLGDAQQRFRLRFASCSRERRSFAARRRRRRGRRGFRAQVRGGARRSCRSAGVRGAGRGLCTAGARRARRFARSARARRLRRRRGARLSAALLPGDGARGSMVGRARGRGARGGRRSSARNDDGLGLSAGRRAFTAACEERAECEGRQADRCPSPHQRVG